MAVLTTERKFNCLYITISRPEALNALNAEVLDQLDRYVQEGITDNEIKGMIITGAGEKAFVAGADIRELSAVSKKDALALSEKGQRIFKKIEESPKPVIAAINGFALGGGCELAMACHLRIATENARFGQPEVNLGIIPGYGATQRLAQLTGRGKALELMLTGDLIPAAEAKTIGLVNHVVATREELMALAEELMKKIFAKAPLAVAKVIKSVNAGFGFETSGYQTEARSFADCSVTEDFKEGTSAFLEKRKPEFKGK